MANFSSSQGLWVCGSADGLKKTPNNHPLLPLLLNILCLIIMLVLGYLTMVLRVLIPKQDQEG